MGLLEEPLPGAHSTGKENDMRINKYRIAQVAVWTLYFACLTVLVLVAFALVALT